MKETHLKKLHNLQHKLYTQHVPFVPGIISRIIRILYSCELPPSVVMGEGTKLVHNGLGVVIHQNAKIGKNCKIYQNVSIAGRNGRGVPVIGDNVEIGAGACVLGGVIIGNNATVGAMACVICDVPDDSTVVGIPARIVKKKET